MTSTQWHIKVDDDELIAGISHEHKRAGGTRTGTILEVLRDGLLLRRYLRRLAYERSYLEKYPGGTRDVPPLTEQVYDEVPQEKETA